MRSEGAQRKRYLTLAAAAGTAAASTASAAAASTTGTATAATASATTTTAASAAAVADEHCPDAVLDHGPIPYSRIQRGRNIFHGAREVPSGR